MAIDIKDSALSEGTISVFMVSQTNLNNSLGELRDVDLSSSSLTYDYYSDTRTSGKLTFHGASQYIRGSFIRIVYTVPSLGYSETLGTYMVTDISHAFQNRADTVTLTLQSAGLYPLSLHLTATAITLNRGTKASNAIKNLLKQDNRDYVFTATNDYSIGSDGLALTSNETYLKEIYTLATLANIKVGVNPLGQVTFVNRTYPLQNTARYTLDANDAHGIVQNDYTRDSDELTVPSEVVVSYTGSDNTKSDAWKEEMRRRDSNYQDSITITAVSKVTGNNSAETRGYTVTRFESESELIPSTYAKAKSMADRDIKIFSTPDTSWKITTSYFPISIGDVIEFIPRADDNAPYTESHKTFVSSADLNLSTMSWSLTLKEATTYDPKELGE